ncbi:MAG TPA: putative glycoside hydrolase, partial [Anaerolineae bacterium]
LFEGQSELSLVLTPNTTTATIIDKYTNQPVIKAQVQITGTSVTVDQDGRAVLRRVKAGDMVRAAAPGYESGSATFTGDGDIQVVLRPDTLDGIITDTATGRPISGTLIYLGNTVVQSDAKGAYHFDRVPAKAPLMFKAPGYLKTQIDASGTAQRSVKLAPFLVKAIHVPYGIPEERVYELMDMVNQTELNAIVLDVKSEKGRIAWDSQVPLARAIGAPQSRGINLVDVVKKCRAQNIYCIARLAVFQDNRLAGAYPDLAIRTLAGSVYADSGGASWANPYKTEVWDYNIALAQEVAALGFDEIQFDYVRFPGRITGVSFGTDYTEETRIAAIAGFLARAQKALRPTGAFVSADVFGLTTATEDDQGTGQRLRDLGPYLDYVSPMVYPDTWVEASDLLSRGLGIRNCTVADLCPYDIVYNSYKRAIEKTSTKVRLWLQAYQGHGDYGVTQFRLQKKAANDTGSYGWMFWSGTGTYDPKTFDPTQ